VLGNLLGNALKYSPDGHPVRVRVTRNGDESVDFAVIDRGQGIAPEFVSHMFKPFETGGNTPADGERAVGLGLAIVKRIVDAHGGSVMLESTPGEGSTFRVRLPIVQRSMSSNGA
jgi:signal transduction histidine kinase